MTACMNSYVRWQTERSLPRVHNTPGILLRGAIDVREPNGSSVIAPARCAQHGALVTPLRSLRGGGGPLLRVIVSTVYNYSMSDLTPRQANVLRYIQRALNETGMPPTRAEIAAELGFRSPNAAEQHQ